MLNTSATNYATYNNTTSRLSTITPSRAAPSLIAGNSSPSGTSPTPVINRITPSEASEKIRVLYADIEALRVVLRRVDVHHALDATVLSKVGCEWSRGGR
jgi:hypothetical protein